MNKVALVGNLTRDPELTQTQNGISLCKFSIAVNRNFTSANGERETDFISVIAWRNLADNCARFLEKGRKVAVTGSLQTSSYEDRDGAKRYRTDVVADSVEFLPIGNNGAAEGAQTAQSPQTKKISDLKPANDTDLPF